MISAGGAGQVELLSQTWVQGKQQLEKLLQPREGVRNEPSLCCQLLVIRVSLPCNLDAPT